MIIRSVSQILKKLSEHQAADASDFAALIRAEGADARLIADMADDINRAVHGGRVLVRGLLEIGNRCRNNCLYCGIRAGNEEIHRYSMSSEEIVESCREAYKLGFRTFVLQGGEWPADDAMIERTVEEIASEMPEAAITLSLGERPDDIYRRWRAAGATRYLLRHETADSDHYSRLHPAAMKLSERMECLECLKSQGYQTGCGMMVGSPGQTVASLCKDLMFIQRFEPEMVGTGPFIPHKSTPLGACPVGSVDLTLRLMSILRIMLPHANIPATTALATLSTDGRERGLKAGANVVMPNITPVRYRGDYQLYEKKASSGAESAQGLDELRQRVEALDMTLDFSRGDFKIMNICNNV